MRVKNKMEKLPYPLRSAEELAGCLIAHGFLEEDAWHDAEDWDGGIERDAIYRMHKAILEQNPTPSHDGN